ncbi:peptidase U32 family protein [Sporolactobacillus sp. THM19-2]|uniref:peptidase U32 family protein n=1 Tax=Sporolactobacillus sp. THM19-2 TaxID=2511171 RepID=UPI00101F059F|nr:peptidase U32 family protein [Sporolactobacillus sp. THM19-2]RYL93742.1 U32 family peptidase [Sporolactobacillus sp. THM19-2]
MNLIATAESAGQAEALLDAGVDTLYVGGHPFGLRLPRPLGIEEIKEIIHLAHGRGKKVTVACNALMHNKEIEQLGAYLSRLAELQADAITVGDPGAILTLEELKLPLPYIYDGETLVTSAEQIAFWLKHHAVGAVAARELTLIELKEMQSRLEKPIEVLVYGPTCIHQSGRPLLSNYYRYEGMSERSDKDRGLFLRDPKNPESQYPIFEDEDGTHIFSTEDLSLMAQLQDLKENRLIWWKLDGVLLRGEPFVRIAALFAEAKQAVESGTFEPAGYCNRLKDLQPANRQLGTGFYLKDPKEIH